MGAETLRPFEVEQRQQLRRVRPGTRVEQWHRGVGVVDTHHTGEPKEKPSATGQGGGRGGESFRVMGTQPGEHRVWQAREAHRTVDPERRFHHSVAQPGVHLRGGSSIGPQHGGTRRFPAVVDQPTTVTLRGQREEPDVVRCAGEHLVDRCDHRAPHRRHVLFGPSGVRSADFGGVPGHRDLATGLVEDDGLDQRGSGVDRDRRHPASSYERSRGTPAQPATPPRTRAASRTHSVSVRFPVKYVR